jgi:hypothetical protein
MKNVPSYRRRSIQPSQRTFSTSKQYISSLFTFSGVFAHLNPDPMRIRIHNTAKQARHLPGYNSVFVGCASWIPNSAQYIDKRYFAYNPVYDTDKNHRLGTTGTHFHVTDRILKM